MKSLVSIWSWLKGMPKDAGVLTLYMKSGNVIRLDCIQDWKLTGDNNDLKKISITQKGKGTHIALNTLVLNQVEAITHEYK